VNDKDKEVFLDLLKERIPKFGVDVDKILQVNENGELKRIIFVNFMQGREAEPKHYCEITDIEQFLSKMEQF